MEMLAERRMSPSPTTVGLLAERIDLQEDYDHP
jgi:hypothetical protein